MKKNLEVIQEEISDCGVCSLLSIIRYYGGNASLENLRIDSLTTKEGVNAYNLIECARKNGFDAKGLKSKSLEKMTFPCIAHININESLSHFIVIYNIKGNILEVMDPAIGFKKIELDYFNKISSNIYIELIPKHNFEYYKITKTAESKFNSLIKKYKYSLLKIILTNIIFIILTLILSSYAKAMDYPEFIPYTFLLFILINIFTNYLSYIIDKSITNLANKTNKELLSSFLNHVFRLPLKYIHMKDKNEIIKRVEEIEIINKLMLNLIINLILNVMIAITIIVLESFLFIFSLIPIIILQLLSYSITILSLKKIKSMINESINYSTEYKSCLINYVSNINSIYHSNTTHNYLNLLNNKLNKYLDIESKNDIVLSKVKTMKNTISTSFLLFSNLILLYFVTNDNLPLSILIIINYLNNILLNATDNLTNLIPSYYYYHSISNKINEFYNLEEINSETNGVIRDNFSISFNKVSFAFNKFNTPINNLNITFKQGDKILIKGNSGCGKSTLFKILTKEYLDYHGKIKIGSVNLKNISLYELYNNIYYLSQDEYIFVDTIKNNITMHNKYTNDEINRVIKLTNLDNLLDKKSFGINTFLYGGGEELSGGERQLILIARALISHAKIIILDEPLSEVNEDLEEKIINNIISEYKNKTILYVSHKQNKNYPMKIINVEERSKNGNKRK